jgi:glutamate--cysteine ligase
MEPIAQALDKAHDSDDYSRDLKAQGNKVRDPELTPSARILREMREQDLPFFRLAMAYSERWAQYYRNRELPAGERERLEQEAVHSLAAQGEIEQRDDVSFEQYLDNFYSQYRAL